MIEELVITEVGFLPDAEGPCPPLPWALLV